MRITNCVGIAVILTGVAASAVQATDLSPNSPRAQAAAREAAEERARSPAAAASGQLDRPTSRIIVKYRDRGPAVAPQSGPQMAQRLGERAGVPLEHVGPSTDNAQVLSVGRPASEEELKEIAERIARENPDVEYAEPERIMRIQQVADPDYPKQWHYNTPAVSINVEGAWPLATGRTVIVAVIDTGIRPHADLAGQILPGYDFITDVAGANDGDGRDADASDPGDWCPSDAVPMSSWHGTHVAGTIAALANNGQGGVGAAYGARLLPVRALGRCGGSNIDISAAILWAAGISVPGVPDNPTPAQVINLSLGGSGPCGPRYTDVIRRARQRGATVVVAAGNSDADAANFAPANCDGVIAVAATSRQGARAYFGGPNRGSNYGGVIKIAAPGGETFAVESSGIFSTLNAGTRAPSADSYEYYQGTSMAAPHVAAVVALLYQQKPSITPDEILSILQSTSQPFPRVTSRQCTIATCGAGIVDAAAALDHLRQLPAVGAAMARPK